MNYKNNNTTFCYNKDGSIGVVIDKLEYMMIEEAAKNMWANTKKGKWGSGLVNTQSDPYKVERTGRLGELAFGKLLDIPIDLEYKKGGDKQDFIYEDETYDIKTATRIPSYRAGLIKAYHTPDKKFPLRCDNYVFSYVITDDTIKKICGIILVGYIKKEDINDSYIKRAKIGSHYNYEIPYKKLIPIKELL